VALGVRQPQALGSPEGAQDQGAAQDPLPPIAGKQMIEWIRHHALVVAVSVIGILSFALFSWAEYGYFCDQSKSHHEKCSGFWSLEHIHDWAYNAASNWQSEMLFGILLLVVLLKIEGARGADRGDT
jgi:hypothetical protein